MAKRPAIKAPRKPKTVRKTKSETYLVNRKYYGDDEPLSIQNNVDMIRAFNWYHAMKEPEDARQYLKDYFKTDKSFSKQIDRIPDSRLPYTSAWLCRIAVNQKRELTVSEWTKVNNDIADASGHYEEKKEKPKTEQPNIQDRIKDRASDIIGDVEEILDKETVINFYEWLQKNEIPAMYATKIAEYYKPIKDELVEAAVIGIEGYESFTKNQLKAKTALIVSIINDCERYSGNVKKARAPRKKKAPTVDKILKYFVYLKESNEHKLTSINPQSIIGSQTLWTFNTTNNVLTVFNAASRDGLTINRTSIANFDTATSKSMRIGRKTKERLETVIKGGKIVIRRLIEEMNNDANGRLNSNTVLIKAVK